MCCLGHLAEVEVCEENARTGQSRCQGRVHTSFPILASAGQGWPWSVIDAHFEEHRKSWDLALVPHDVTGSPPLTGCREESSYFPQAR